MIKFRFYGLLSLTMLVGCQNEPSETESSNKNRISQEIIEDTTDTLDNIPTVEESPCMIEQPENSWKTTDQSYPHFIPTRQDTIRIGKGQEWESLDAYFTKERQNVFVIVEDGTYYTDSDLWVSGKNIIIKGEGDVSLLCKELYKNVMWVEGENIVIDNLHMMHEMPGDETNQNCSGRVLAFDHANNVTVQNCDLNGCGLAGLHDNLGNGTVYVEYNYIHNNSLGAYTDINGGVWQEEINDHPVFKFHQNRIEDNGHGMVNEEDF
jgi:hypothetical protein